MTWGLGLCIMYFEEVKEIQGDDLIGSDTLPIMIPLPMSTTLKLLILILIVKMASMPSQKKGGYVDLG